eukprot:TRINITY_DN12953_c0_g1_i1.p4 TRINITY_DN12953_c0_g1~~TRINITY_DN12953_c0_g1_i1.p4  ORF type:complete len:109 (+),score=56.12 TRINITY_DN12953_c0_g1_i1:39-329(+)
MCIRDSYMSTLESSDDNQEGKFNPLKSIADTSEFLQKKGEIDDVLDVAFSQLGKYEIELQPFIKIYRDHCPRDFSCLLYTSPSPRDLSTSRMPSSA